MFWCTKSVKFHFLWGTKLRDQKQETGNDCDLWRHFRSPSLKQISPTFSYFLIKNTLLYHFLVNWLAHNKKMIDREICFSWSLQSWNDVIIIFGLTVLYLTGSEISRFWYIKTQGRKIAIEKFFLLYLSVHWGDLIEHIKKSFIYTLSFFYVVSQNCHWSITCFNYISHCFRLW